MTTSELLPERKPAQSAGFFSRARFERSHAPKNNRNTISVNHGREPLSEAT